jgi:hypothetical protein
VKRVVVVADGELHVETALGSLAAAGLEGVTAADVAAARSLVESGALALVVGVGGNAWEGERARPVVTMHSALRRGCVVALVGDDYASLDGTRAFALGVDLVVKRGDLASLGELVNRALTSKRSLVAPLDCAAASRLGG